MTPSPFICTQCEQPMFENGPCPICEAEARPRYTLDEISNFSEFLSNQIDIVCQILNLDYDSYGIDGSGVEVHYSRPACSSGCCGWESGTDTFPFSYLTLSREELLKTEEARKLEAERKHRERANKALEARKKREAEARLQKARAKLRTAQKDAEKELQEAERRLQQLGGAE